MEDWLADAHYVPDIKMILRGLGITGINQDEPSTAVNSRFLTFLINEFYRRLPFDPNWYRSYTDLAAAYDAGRFRNAGDLRRHYLNTGVWEGRTPAEVPFDPEFYLAQMPELAAIFAVHGAAGLLRHYLEHGRHEGRASHPALAEAAARWREATGVEGLDFAARTIDGALIQPFRGSPLAPGPTFFCGGVVLGDGPIDRKLRHRRGHRPVDCFLPNDQPVHPLAGEYIYGGPFYFHFGHAMGEFVHRILPARVRFGCRKILFVDGVHHHAPPGGWDDLPGTIQAALSFLDVAPDDIMVVRDNRVVERLHVAQQGVELGTGPAPFYLTLLNEFTGPRLNALPDNGPPAQRLYVSRSRITEGGLILGEAYLERVLAMEGWTVFHPQDWSLTDQMQTYRRAETLLFPAGSACHGLEFFGPGAIGHCLLFSRGHLGDSYFDSIIAPRARRYDKLTGASWLGTAAADPTGAPVNQLGVSILNLPAFIDEMRRFGLAEFGAFSVKIWREHARADFERYVEYHRRCTMTPGAPTRLVGEPELSSLRARCAALLG